MTNSYNLSAQLAENLQLYRTYMADRTAVQYPDKPEVPLVWDQYLDTQRPVGDDLSVQIRAAVPGETIAYTAEVFSQTPQSVNWQNQPSEENSLLEQVNNRLKTQARRYPHPITSETEEFL